MRGLIGRNALPAGQGLLLRPAPSIHTAFLCFPIAAVFLNADLRVVQIVERLRPWRIATQRRARALLELAAGEIARRGVKVGDRLSLRDRRPLEAVAKPAPQPSRAGRLEVSESIIWSPSLAHGGGPLSALPRKVLVVSADRHFRSVTRLLLAHRGCAVTTAASVSGVVELLAHNEVDVVVVDAGSSPTGAQRALSAVRSLARPVAVVLVDEKPLHGPSEYPVVEKWGPFADLFAAIERTGESGGGLIGNGARRYSARDDA
jgi:uncharacterized membrane protein (UPF0127 family)